MILLLFTNQPTPTYPTAYAYAYWRNNMNLTRKVSTTNYPIIFMMVDDTDHISGKTGLTPTVTLSKNGGGFNAASGAVTELGGGLYALAGNATDRNTLGELWIHAEATGADNVDLKCDITAHDPYADINSILADTSTDGVVLKAAGLADDAVAEIQSGLALEATLEAIKGTGWSDETLVGLMTAIEAGMVDEATIRSAVGLAAANLDTQLSAIDTAVDGIVSDMATVDEVADAIWDEATADHTTTTTFGSLDANVDAIKAKTDNLPAIPAPANEYDAELAAIQADLNNPDQYKADISALAKTTHVQEIEDKVDAIKLKTDNIPATPANEATLTAIKGTGWSDETLVALMNAIEAISVGSGATPQQIWEYVARTLTDASGLGLATEASQNLISNDLNAMPGKVWNHPTRTLTQSGSTVEYPAEGDPLVIYRDTTVAISLVNLGNVTGADKMWFTVKDNVEDVDSKSIIQIDTNGLQYINGAPAGSAIVDGGIVINDPALGNISIFLKQEQAARLPLYEAYPTRWDVKVLKDGIVTILNIGSMYIKGTPTRAIL